MFGLGMGEILVIAVVALLFLGPEKLPGAAKSLSKGIRDLRRTTKDLQRSIEDDTQVGDAIRDLKSALRGEDVQPYVPPHVRDNDDDGPKTHKASASPGPAEPGPAEPGDDVPEAEPGENEAPPKYTYGNDTDEPLIRPASETVASGEQLEPTPADEPNAKDDEAHG